MIAKAHPGADWKDDAADLLRQIDSEAATVPLYLFDMAEVGTPECNAIGCWSSLFDLQLRDQLRAKKRWAGRGFCTLIDARRSRERYPAAINWRRQIRATVVHEFAHFLAASPLGSEQRVDEILAEVPNAAKLLELPITVGDDAPNSEPFKGHCGIQFGRAAIHLTYRANLILGRGYFHLSDIWGSETHYSLDRPMKYAQLLGDEVRERIDEPVRAIINSPCPPAYEAFCRADIERARTLFQTTRDHQ